MDYLIAKGISSSRLVAKGYGQTEPIDTNDTLKKEGEKNRRTELRILSQIIIKNIKRWHILYHRKKIFYKEQKGMMIIFMSIITEINIRVALFFITYFQWIIKLL